MSNIYFFLKADNLNYEKVHAFIEENSSFSDKLFVKILQKKVRGFSIFGDEDKITGRELYLNFYVNNIPFDFCKIEKKDYGGAFACIANRIKNNQHHKDLDGNDISSITDEARDEIAGDFYRQAANKGYVEALYVLGGMIQDGAYCKDLDGNDISSITDEERDEIIGDLYRQAAKKGYVDALYVLGGMIQNGTYCKDLDGEDIRETTDEEDDEIAGDLYRQTAKKGEARGLYSLAFMIQNGTYCKGLDGEGVTDENRNKNAGDLYRQAANRESGPAFQNLAEMIKQKEYHKALDGRDISSITDESRNQIIGDLYRQAAKKGVPEGLFSLSSMIHCKTYYEDLAGNEVTDKNRDHIAVSLMDKLFEEDLSENYNHEDFLEGYVYLGTLGFDSKSLEERKHIYASLMAKVEEKCEDNYHLFLRAYASSLLKLDDAEEKVCEAVGAGFTEVLLLLPKKNIPDESSQESLTNRDDSSDNDGVAASIEEEGVASAEEEEGVASTEEEESMPAPSLSTKQRRAISRLQVSNKKRDEKVECDAEAKDKAARDEKSEAWKLKVEEDRIKKEEKRIESKVAKDREGLTKLKSLSSGSLNKSEVVKVAVSFEYQAEVDLRKLPNDNMRSDRLPHLIEALKIFECGGLFKLEPLKTEKDEDGNQIYSGRMTHGDRLHASRVIKDGKVVSIKIFSLLGHDLDRKLLQR